MPARRGIWPAAAGSLAGVWEQGQPPPTIMECRRATASAMCQRPTRVQAPMAALKTGRLGARCARWSVLWLSGPAR